MSKRRRFSTEFKTNVVLETLSERYTMSELAQRHQLHPTKSLNGRSSDVCIFSFSQMNSKFVFEFLITKYDRYH